ncbi:MAG: hypothetical protein IJM20_07125 [Clostridia bacterium]|nr:hypothetical protein [Clostridia bacterium]
MKKGNAFRTSLRMAKRLLGAGSALIFGAALLLSAPSCGGSTPPKRESVVLYLSQGEYRAVTEIDPEGHEVLASAGFVPEGEDADSLAYRVDFSANGNAYYYTGSGENLALNRAPISDMNAKALKDGKLPLEVCEGVRMGFGAFREFGDGTVIFLDQSNCLCYFDGESIIELFGEPVEAFRCDGEKNCLIVVSEGPVYGLYRIGNADPETKTLLDGGAIGYFMTPGDDAYCFYSNGAALNCVGITGEKTEVTAGGKTVGTAGDKVYFLEPTERFYVADSSNSYNVFDLFCFTAGGGRSLCAEDVVHWRKGYQCLVFNTVPMLNERYLGRWETYPGRVIEGQQNSVLLFDSAEVYRLGISAAEKVKGLTSLGHDWIYVGCGASLYLYRGERSQLYYAETDGGSITGLVSLANQATPIGRDGDILFFETGFAKTAGTCSIYSCSGGELACLARDVLFDSPYAVYRDGAVVCSTAEGLAFFRGGEGKTVGDAAELFIRIGKNELVYISGGRLYHCSGALSTLLDENVDYVWSSRREEMIEHWS